MDPNAASFPSAARAGDTTHHPFIYRPSRMPRSLEQEVTVERLLARQPLGHGALVGLQPPLALPPYLRHPPGHRRWRCPDVGDMLHGVRQCATRRWGVPDVRRAL